MTTPNSSIESRSSTTADDLQSKHPQTSSEIPLQDFRTHQYHPLAPAAPWQTGFWRRFPWTGFLALFFALIAALAMAVVLRISDGKEVRDWKWAPSVYLSIASTVANALLVYALARGAEIAFWVKALKPSTTVRDLHNDWSFGTGLKDALLSGRSFNFIALAGIAVALAPINGPFLQRASTVSTKPVTTLATLNVSVAQQFPFGYTGTITGRSHQVSFLNSNFSTVVKDYNAGRAYNLTTKSGCLGQCFGTLHAAGYQMNCTPSTGRFNISRILSPGKTSYTPATIFTTNFTFLEGNEATFEVMNFTSTVKSSSSCEGDLQTRQCTLLPALLQQRVLLINNSISLDPSFSYRDDKLVKYTPAHGFSAQGPGSTHGGMALVLSAMFDSSASLVFNGAIGFDLTTSGAPTYQYSSTDFDPQSCNISWSDPTDDMLSTARDLAFRTALRSADNPNSTNIQVFQAMEENTPTVYKSHYLFLALALLFTLLGIVCVVPIFLGFWSLGRNVSLSPVEIAKAFNAEMLRSSDSNADVKPLLDEVGAREVKYGAVNLVGDGAERLVMSEPRWVGRPRVGVVYGG